MRKLLSTFAIAAVLSASAIAVSATATATPTDTLACSIYKPHNCGGGGGGMPYEPR